MSGSRAARNNVLAGVFVLASIAIAVLFVVAFTDLSDRLKSKARYLVQFGMLDGADGLDAGSPVKVGGQRVGEVEKWSFNRDPLTNEPIAIDVTIAIDRSIRLFSDADVALVRPLLGGQSSINISAGAAASGALADGIQGPPRPVEPDALDQISLRGHIGSPGFISPSDYARVRQTLANVEEFTGMLSEYTPIVVSDARETMAGIRRGADSVTGLSDEIRPVAADVRKNWPAWSERVSGVLARIDEEVSAAKGVGERVRSGVDQFNAFLDRGNAIIDENRENIRRFTSDITEVARRFRESEYDRLVKIIGDAERGVQSAADTFENVERLVIAKSPEIEELVTSATLSAQQLRLAVTEIRASPWRLLYQPGKKELENELLYNSVRQYSNAVSELRLAADSVRLLGEQAAAGSTPVPPERVAELTEKLNRAFAEYQEQERAFFDRWVREAR